MFNLLIATAPEYSAPRQIEQPEDPAAEQEPHMVVPAYRNVDPPEEVIQS